MSINKYRGEYMERILIIGKRSYVGVSLKTWLEKFPANYKVAIVSSKNYEWKKAFSEKFDVVIDLAGVAHINNIKDNMKDVFYSVNRDLSIEIAKWSKDHGIHHFIFFSSMNVYGDYCGTITDIEKTCPSGFYGDSKLQGDIGIRNLEDSEFLVSVLRPPFIYGKQCTGNYNIISSIAKKVPIFPLLRNKKSMIYIDNLCEFVRLIIDNKERGIFIPQNRELVSTVDLVREIARVNGKRVCFTGAFNWLLRPASKKIRMLKKAFADDSCDLKISSYYNYDYCIVNFPDSIFLTEK